MKPISLLLIALCLSTSAVAAEKEDALAELDAKITAGLARDQWDEASKEFVRAMWADYRKAFLKGTPEDGVVRSLAGKMPDAKEYAEYLGAFGRESAPERPFLEVVQDDEGRFLVILEGHRIPAVRTNKTVVFTTGDVVFARWPQLGEKPYCTLELFMLVRTGGTFYLADPVSPPEKWMRLSKLKAK